MGNGVGAVVWARGATVVKELTCESSKYSSGLKLSPGIIVAKHSLWGATLGGVRARGGVGHAPEWNILGDFVADRVGVPLQSSPRAPYVRSVRKGKPQVFWRSRRHSGAITRASPALWNLKNYRSGASGSSNSATTKAEGL